jgi:hypothetical protein
LFVNASAPTTPNPAERLALILDALCKAVAAHGARGVLTVTLQLLLWSRLSRMAQRSRRLAARIAAGTPLFTPRTRAPRRTPSRPYARLPGSLTWLIRAVPGTAFGAGHVRLLLTDPHMAALADAPPMRRLLRPLCRLLGVEPPAAPAAPQRNEGAPPPPDTGEPSRTSPHLPPLSGATAPASHAITPPRAA